MTGVFEPDVEERIRQEMFEHLPRLRRFAYGLTGSLDEGDDLVQATVERAIRHLDKWQVGTRLDSWMFQITRNLFLNTLCARKVRGESVDPAQLDRYLAVDGVRAVGASLTFAAVRGFIARLPEEQRSVLLLVAVDGRSYKEAARLLDLPMGTVTSRLARARIAIRNFIDATENPGPRGQSEAV